MQETTKCVEIHSDTDGHYIIMNSDSSRSYGTEEYRPKLAPYVAMLELMNKLRRNDVVVVKTSSQSLVKHYRMEQTINDFEVLKKILEIEQVVNDKKIGLTMELVDPNRLRARLVLINHLKKGMN